MNEPGLSAREFPGLSARELTRKSSRNNEVVVSASPAAQVIQRAVKSRGWGGGEEGCTPESSDSELVM
jgi:hypothetical protein